MSAAQQRDESQINVKMGRFVTPSKVVILILARLYLRNSVPFSGTTKVLDVLMSKILPDASDRDDSVRQQDGEDILDLEKALSREQSAIPGRSIWDLLLKDIWTIDCVDALDDFITQTPLLLGKTREDLLRERDEGVVPEPAGKVVRTSPLGTFIRRCSLEYVRLQFQDSVALWTDFIAYRMPSKAAFTRKNPHALRNAFDINLADLGIDISHPLASLMYRSLIDDGDTTQKFASTYDVEKLMEFQVSEMQGKGNPIKFYVSDSDRLRWKIARNDEDDNEVDGSSRHFCAKACSLSRVSGFMASR